MSELAQTTLPEGVEVTFRRVRFDFADTPRYWHSNSPFLTHFFTALSLVFPEGEKFFVDSARNYRDADLPPHLREELQAFIQQESHHGYQHGLLNDLAERHGVDTKRYDAWLARALGLARRWMPHSAQLSMTVALEHFTAVLANQLLTNPRNTEGMHPSVKPLWLWHAAEETEHKAVCFDLYQTAVGSYWIRVLVMARVLFGFPMGISLLHFTLMARDGQLLNFRDIARGLVWMFGREGLVRGIGPALRAYFRRDFHPWEQDNHQLIAEWSATRDAAITG